MPFQVVLDSNIVLAACFDPKMDAKAELAAGGFRTLREEGLRPAITESIRIEIETKINERVGQILDALRSIASQPPVLPADSSETTLEVLERIFAKLRKGAPGTAGALQVLESRLAALLSSTPILNEAQWKDLIGRVAYEATLLLAEVQRRQDLLGLEVLGRFGKPDHGRFRQIVPKSDLEHVSIMAAFSEAKRTRALFVTIDSNLHGVREDIGRKAPDVVVTTPTYLRGQIAKLRE